MTAMRLFLIVLIFSLCSTFTKAQTYYDSKGNATIYYNRTNNTFFSFDGEPLYYLKNDAATSDVHIYNFKGKHIGWYSSGRLYSNTGDIFLFTKNSGVDVIFGLEQIKGIEQILPLKEIEELAPIKPLFSNKVVSAYIPGVSNSNQTTSTYNRQPNFDSYKTEGYKLPVNAILNAIDAQTQYHQEMIRKGYEFHNNTWVTKEQLAKIGEAQDYYRRSFEEFLADANSHISFRSNMAKPKKKGYYMIYFGSAEMGVREAKVLVKKSGKLKGFYFPHPSYGYMYFGIYKRPKGVYPCQYIKYVGYIKRRDGFSPFVEGAGYLFWHKGVTKV
jgi:hypothetical protein